MRGFDSHTFCAVVSEVVTSAGEVVVESYQDYNTYCVGLPFLARTQPTIDWKQRVLRVERNWKVFEIKAPAFADSHRKTCPVVRVAKL